MTRFYKITNEDGTSPIIPLTIKQHLKDAGRVYEIKEIQDQDLARSSPPKGMIKTAIDQRFPHFITQIESNSAQGPVEQVWWQANFDYYYEYRDEDEVKVEGLVDYRSYLSELFIKQLCINPAFIINEEMFQFDENDADQAKAVIDSAFCLFQLCVDNQNDHGVKCKLLPALLNIYYEFQTICKKNEGKIGQETKQYFDAQFNRLCQKIGFNIPAEMLRENDGMVTAALQKMKAVLPHPSCANDNGVNKQYHEGYKALVEEYESLPENTPLERFLKLQEMQKVVAAREPEDMLRNMARNDTGERMLRYIGLGKKPDQYIPGLSNQVLTSCQSALSDYDYALSGAYLSANPQASSASTLSNPK